MSVVEYKREIEKYKDANIKIRSEIQIKEDIISKQNEEKKALTNRVKYLENFLNNLIVNCCFIKKNGVIPPEALQGIK
jgi:hypothetical protein